jgi:hypothetical protein
MIEDCFGKQFVFKTLERSFSMSLEVADLHKLKENFVISIGTLISSYRNGNLCGDLAAP